LTREGRALASLFFAHLRKSPSTETAADLNGPYSTGISSPSTFTSASAQSRSMTGPCFALPETPSKSSPRINAPARSVAVYYDCRKERPSSRRKRAGGRETLPSRTPSPASSHTAHLLPHCRAAHLHFRARDAGVPRSREDRLLHHCGDICNRYWKGNQNSRRPETKR